MTDDEFNDIFKDEVLEKAKLLLGQGRIKEAKVILIENLQKEPDNTDYLALYSLIEAEYKNIQKSLELINSAIALRPNTDNYYYIKSIIYIYADNYEEAEKCIKTAVELAPDEPDYYAKWATIKYIKKDFEGSLNLAQKSIELDAENEDGLNILGMALMKVKKTKESFEALESSLAKDPNNTETHTYYGMALLEKGNHELALKHFQKALSINADFTPAKDGMIEALKAKNFFYRIFLKYSFWLESKNSSFQWKVLISFFIVYRVLFFLKKKVHSLESIVTPILVLMIIFAFSSWLIPAFSNLFLRLSQFSKHLLNKNETTSANLVGSSLFVSLLSIILYFITKSDILLLTAGYGLAFVIPFSRLFDSTRYKNILFIYTGILLLLSITSVIYGIVNGDVFNVYVFVYFISFVVFQFGINYININKNE